MLLCSLLNLQVPYLCSSLSFVYLLMYPFPASWNWSKWIIAAEQLPNRMCFLFKNLCRTGYHFSSKCCYHCWQRLRECSFFCMRYTISYCCCNRRMWNFLNKRWCFWCFLNRYILCSILYLWRQNWLGFHYAFIYFWFFSSNRGRHGNIVAQNMDKESYSGSLCSISHFFTCNMSRTTFSWLLTLRTHSYFLFACLQCFIRYQILIFIKFTNRIRTLKKITTFHKPKKR